MNCKQNIDEQINLLKVIEDEISIIHCSEKKTIYVGEGEKYNSILKALLENGENTRVYLRAGEYNIVNEYEEYYGTDYFVNYDGYTNSSNLYDAGLFLLDGVELCGDSGAKIVFDYNGNNEKVRAEFSPLNMTANNIIDNIIIEVGDYNCRYHIHDDFSHFSKGSLNLQSKGRNIIQNCVFIGESNAGSVIGGGMGAHMSYIVKNNIFKQKDSSIYSISYHNWHYEDAKNHIVIEGNYCTGKVGLWKYGKSIFTTNAIVVNNSALAIECVPHPSAGMMYNNIVMYEWNNEIRVEE